MFFINILPVLSSAHPHDEAARPLPRPPPMLGLVEVHGSHPSPDAEIHHLRLPNELLLVRSSPAQTRLAVEPYPRSIPLQTPLSSAMPFPSASSVLSLSGRHSPAMSTTTSP